MSNKLLIFVVRKEEPLENKQINTMEKITVKGKKLLRIDLNELEKLNNISLKLGYNRGFRKNFKKELFNSEPNSFILVPLMFHDHKEGDFCGPHIRYSVFQREGDNYKRNYILDLPLDPIEELLI